MRLAWRLAWSSSRKECRVMTSQRRWFAGIDMSVLQVPTTHLGLGSISCRARNPDRPFWTVVLPLLRQDIGFDLQGLPRPYRSLPSQGTIRKPLPSSAAELQPVQQVVFPLRRQCSSLASVSDVVLGTTSDSHIGHVVSFQDQHDDVS